jgi:type II secretory pathway pseudopilin PulG
MKNNFKKQRGFSVVEIIIAIFILTLIGGAAISFQLNTFSLNKLSGNNLLAQEDMRRVLKNFSSEVRSLSQPLSGVHVIDTAGTSSLIFYTNMDSSADIEKVRYFLSGTELKKGVIKPTGTPAVTYSASQESVRTLARNIVATSTDLFSYYDSDYDGTTAPLAQPVNIPDIRLVKVNVMIDDDITRAPAPLYMTTQVSIRNLKDNL